RRDFGQVAFQRRGQSGACAVQATLATIVHGAPFNEKAPVVGQKTDTCNPGRLYGKGLYRKPVLVSARSRRHSGGIVNLSLERSCSPSLFGGSTRRMTSSCTPRPCTQIRTASMFYRPIAS